MTATPGQGDDHPVRLAPSGDDNLERREQAVCGRERALEAAMLGLERLHERIRKERAGMLETDAGAPAMPELTTRALARGLAKVREDALQQRLEACEVGERRVAALEAELEQAHASFRARAAQREAAERELERAEAAARTEAERAGAAARAEADARQRAAPAASSQVPTEARPAERRSARRVGLVAEVSLASETNFYSGFSSDLSEGGLFVATVERASLGAAVNLKFTLPHGAEIEAQGEVRWIRELSPVQPDLMPGVGVAFTEISPAALAEISRFVAQREPMFFPDA